MKMDSAFRQRIDMLRFFLIVGLVLLHYGTFPSSDLSGFRGFQDTEHPVATFVNAFVLFFFLSAVPLLSAISGWLFFRGSEHSLAFYGRRITARTRSILLPMIAWNGIVLVVFASAAAVYPDPRVAQINYYDVTNLDAEAVINALIGVTRHPISFQFWFLRDLFLTVLLSPVLGFALRRAPALGAVVLGGAWFLDYDFGIFFRTDVVFFFYLGGLIRLRQWKVDFTAPKLATALLAAYLVLVGLRTIGPYYIPEESTLGVALFDYGTRIMRLLGVTAVWLCAPFLLQTFIGRKMAAIGTVAFFLHAAHWPLNQVIKVSLGMVMPERTDLVLLINYSVTAIATIALTLIAARLLDSTVPGVFNFLSGGRSRTWSVRGAKPVTAQKASQTGS
jgi:succinoglycan biosynthesis protein ExoH